MRAKAQTNEDLFTLREVKLLKIRQKRVRTYLRRGRNVRDQIMALIPPMTSSLGGTGPDVGQMPLRT